MNSYTIALEAQQVERLRAVLEERGFAFRDVPHAHFGAGNGSVQVVAYKSGKAVVQGKGTREFVEFCLEPEVTGLATVGYEKALNPERFVPHIGVDESGKGDFFGPLVVAGVYLDEAGIDSVIAAGVRDSKTVSSTKRIFELADIIRDTPRVKHKVIAISPARYNEMQKKMRSVNEVLGWGHAKVIELLLEVQPNCKRAVSDQFARTEWTVKKHLGPRARGIELEQRHKAESDPAVAAASILAREGFVLGMARLGKELGAKLPLGASAAVKQLAVDLVRQYGADRVAQAVKTHFKTWTEVTGEAA